MAERIISMRALLKENIEALGSKHDWSHITSQVRLLGDIARGPKANLSRLACSHILG